MTQNLSSLFDLLMHITCDILLHSTLCTLIFANDLLYFVKMWLLYKRPIIGSTITVFAVAAIM